MNYTQVVNYLDDYYLHPSRDLL